MDETEVTNVDYREYLHWLRRVYTDYPRYTGMPFPTQPYGEVPWATMSLMWRLISGIPPLMIIRLLA
jgi:hypothetical protein